MALTSEITAGFCFLLWIVCVGGAQIQEKLVRPDGKAPEALGQDRSVELLFHELNKVNDRVQHLDNKVNEMEMKNNELKADNELLKMENVALRNYGAGANLAGYPAAFDIYRTTSYSTIGIISYSYVLVNVGGGISSASEGVFRAPLDGVYMFTLNFDEMLRGTTLIYIRKNGSAIATIRVFDTVVDGNGYTDSTSGDAVIVQLAKGDRVDTYLVEGGLEGEADAHFTGHLLFPV